MRCAVQRFVVSATTLAAVLVTRPAAGCSVCYGDPDSEMVRGALMGVYVMVGVVTSVLACVAGTGLFWLQRARRLGPAAAENPRGLTPDVRVPRSRTQ